MQSDVQTRAPRILILATFSGGFRGADSVGQVHANYPANTYILPVLSPAMFPEEFYLQTFERGIDAIIVMYSGTDCPYKGAAERTAQIVNRVYPMMKERGLDTRRLRLVAICTVCVKPFLKEVNQMNDLLKEIGPVEHDLQPQASALAE
ncbi:MAG: hydrogenase iron-sulfur subunit [Anaerolineales bacterium]|jgi:F420-non-reducing hydrogenase iron-sulfur subunit